MNNLFSMAEEIFKNKLNVILIQIDEAHSYAWPLPISDYFDEEPIEPQKTFENRITRANYFVKKYNPPFSVYIDNWNNDFAELFRAWPDKFHCINKKNFEVVARSMYGTEGESEALIIEDYTKLLRNLIKKINYLLNVDLFK